MEFDISELTQEQLYWLKYLLEKGAGRYLKRGIGEFYDKNFHLYTDKKGNVKRKASVGYFLRQ